MFNRSSNIVIVCVSQADMGNGFQGKEKELLVNLEKEVISKVQDKQ